MGLVNVEAQRNKSSLLKTLIFSAGRLNYGIPAQIPDLKQAKRSVRQGRSQALRFDVPAAG